MSQNQVVNKESQTQHVAVKTAPVQRVSTPPAGAGMSISAMLNTTNKTQPVSRPIASAYASVVATNVNLSEQKIAELWLRYARSIEQSDTHLYTVMQTAPRVEEHTVKVKVKSELQANTLKSSVDLVEFLRKETGDRSLIIGVEIEPRNEEQEEILYTPKSKLDKMISENSEIKNLVQLLSLEIY